MCERRIADLQSGANSLTPRPDSGSTEDHSEPSDSKSKNSPAKSDRLLGADIQEPLTVAASAKSPLMSPRKIIISLPTRTVKRSHRLLQPLVIDDDEHEEKDNASDDELPSYFSNHT